MGFSATVAEEQQFNNKDGEGEEEDVILYHHKEYVSLMGDMRYCQQPKINRDKHIPFSTPAAPPLRP